MSALVRVHADRPAFATTIEGVKVCVSLHDTWFLETRQKLRAALVNAHPDRGGFRWTWERTQAKLKRHDEDAVRWYAEVGLPPPIPLKTTAPVKFTTRPLLGQWRDRSRVTKPRHSVRNRALRTHRESTAFCQLVHALRRVWPSPSPQGAAR